MKQKKSKEESEWDNKISEMIKKHKSLMNEMDEKGIEGEKRYTDKTDDKGFYDLKCPKCGKFVKKIDLRKPYFSYFNGECQYCGVVIRADLTKKDRTEDVEKAKKIIKENLTSEGFEFYDEEEAFLVGRYVLPEGEIVCALIKNEFNLKKTVDFLIHEKEIEAQMGQIALVEKNRKLREEAERRLYGKVRKKRGNFTEEERDMILNKFENKCIICGNDEGLHIHHKDGNPQNNQIENVIVLCGVCHKKIHMKVR